MAEELQIRVFGADTLPALVYLPGLHGDWTLITSFRLALANRARFVEITYPRSLAWSMEDYADAIETALLSRGIIRGWLLGESFGSQIAWQLIAGNLTANEHENGGRVDAPFRVEGLVLAGGFVKHPWKRGPGWLRRVGNITPMKLYHLALKINARYARFRHGRSPEALDSITEFVARRTELDRQAMRHRLTLLDQYDPRPVARETRLPVYYLAGFIDPLVPWMLVRRWLRKNCPGYRGCKTFWLADHNVLATSPAPAADLVVEWMNGCQT